MKTRDRTDHHHPCDFGGFSILLDVKVRDEEEANEAIAARLKLMVIISRQRAGFMTRCLCERWKGEGKKFLLEMSGAITEANLRGGVIDGK